MPRRHPFLVPVLLLALGGCATSPAPALRDPDGWPLPTWALMDGIACYDSTHHGLVTARDVWARDRNDRAAGLVCRYGRWENRVDGPASIPGSPMPPPVPPTERPPSAPSSQPIIGAVR